VLTNDHNYITILSFNTTAETQQTVSMTDWKSFARSLALRLHTAETAPSTLLWRKFQFRALSIAANIPIPLSKNRREKLRRSAEKRDPANVLALLERAEDQSISNGRDSDLAPAEGDLYRPYRPNLPSIDPDVRLLAFYLPQFHPFPENDRWWGTGFTEWRSCARAKPLFSGHYQPHLPDHLGFYDLRLPLVMEEQARLARSYGVEGFVFYFYWFAGKTLMEQPLRDMLANPRVTTRFCLSWANENWTWRWDGKDHEVLISQDYSMADSKAFIEHILPYMTDERYIRVDGKLLLLVYKPSDIPDLARHVAIWRKTVREAGLGELYIMGNQRSPNDDFRSEDVDAALEFAPHGLDTMNLAATVDVSEGFSGRIYEYADVVNLALSRPAPEKHVFRSVTLGWDNTARRGLAATIMNNFSSSLYRSWLQALCNQARERFPDEIERRLVFINAWNEWAEGTHLEPDARYGFTYLEATRDAVVGEKAP